MKQSIGHAGPRAQADQDHDGAPDASEREFADTSEIQPTPGDASATQRAARPTVSQDRNRDEDDADDDDGLLESAERFAHHNAPGTSN